MKFGIHETVLLIQREKHYKAQFLNFVFAKWGKKAGYIKN